MLASLTAAPLDDPQFVYEPKYDGIRAIAEVAPKGHVRLWSRLGNEKTHQFPEVADALETWARRRTAPLVLDGEIVALDAKGNPTGFQQLQGRINLGGRESFPISVSKQHSRRAADTETGSRPQRRATDTENDSRPPQTVAFIVFDLLRDGKIDYRDRPLVERRAALERLFARARPPLLRISAQVRGDGRALYKE